MARPPRHIALLAVLVLALLAPAVAHAAPGAVTLVRAAGSAGTPAQQGFLAPTPTPEPPAPESAPALPGPIPTPAPRRPVRRSGAPTARIAGAARPRATSIALSLSRLSVSGRVEGAVSGYVHVTVQRQRGKGWVTVRRAEPHLSTRGRFERAIARLSRGTYRIAARFEGTGTAQPSRSGHRTRRL